MTSVISRSVSTKSRALVVCPTFPFPETSGGRKRTARLLNAMAEAGAVPHVLTPGEPPAEGRAEAQRQGWVVESFGGPAGHSIRRPTARSPELLARLEALTADDGTAFVQLEEHHAARYMDAVAGRRPVVYSSYNVDSKVLRQLARRRSGREALRIRWRAARLADVERSAARVADVVLAVSAADAAYFDRYAREVIEVPNGVDAELYALPDVAGDGDVLFFGQLEYAPNREGLLRFLADGWPAVRARHPEVRLRVAGKGAERLADRPEAGAQAGVDLLGFVEDLGAELLRSSIVVAPLWVGGGTRIKVLEALAAGRPVVGTALAVEQIGFRDGAHGRLAESAAAIGTAAANLLGDGPTLARMGADARRLAGDYHWEATLAPARERYAQWVAAPVGRTGR